MVPIAAFLVVQLPSATDPEAAKAIERMVAAYRKLSAFSAEVRARESVTEVAYQRPGRIRVAAKDGRVNPALVDPISRVVSDGRFLYSVTPKRKGTYLRRPTPTEASLFDAAFDPVMQGGFLRFLLRGDDPLRLFLTSAPGTRLKGLRTGPEAVLDGVPTECVVASFENAAKGEAVDVTFAIGREDHLLRRLSLLPSGAPEATRREIEAYDRVRVDPTFPAGTFVFTPPPGAKAVAEFESPLNPALRVGERPFGLTARTLKGRPFAWEALRGKVVLLDFWATWCMPCVAAIPRLAALRKAYAPQGFEIVSVSADAASDRAKLRAFIDRRGMDWTHLHDADRAVSGRYGVKAYPTTLLIGRDGRIAAVNPSDRDLDEAIRQAVRARGERPPTPH